MKAKHLITVISLLICCPASSRGQVVVSARFEHKAYLVLESVVVRVTVKNETNRALLIGGAGRSAILEFEVVRRKHGPVRRTTEGLIAKNVVLDAGESKEITVDLKPHYDLRAEGEYEIVALILNGEIKYSSEATAIDVVPGMELISADRSVPDQPSRIRTFSLRYWNRSATEYVFLTVTDKKEGIKYGVFPLGPVLRVTPPELVIDIGGGVTVKHQSGHRTFTYSYFKSTRDGVVFLRQEPRLLEEAGKSGTGKTSGED